MGEENKEDQKKEETKKLEEPQNPSEGEKTKKDEAPTEEDAAKKDEAAAAAEPPEIVLKVDMHCEACARKVARALKGFQGVEEVIADSKASKVVVKGKAADPVKVFERLQKKSGKKVELISPLPKPPEPAADQDEVKPQENDTTNKDQKDQEKKDEPPTPITVVLKVRMHCEACAQGLQKRVRKIKGVESVETDLHGGEVTVKGIFDPEKLVEYVKKRTGKQASIVKEEEEKKAESAEEKKEEEKKDVVEEKKEEEKKEGDEAAKVDDEGDDIKRSEYWPKYYTEYHAYPPQMFSDENPNACSVM